MGGEPRQNPSTSTPHTIDYDLLHIGAWADDRVNYDYLHTAPNYTTYSNNAASVPSTTNNNQVNHDSSHTAPMTTLQWKPPPSVSATIKNAPNDDSIPPMLYYFVNQSRKEQPWVYTPVQRTDR